MNLDDFSYEDNDRRYLKPEVSLNEQNAFIDNLRNLQQQDTAKIRQDTYNLGTAVPSNIGGLTGGSSYFTSRYQTPQTNSMVSDLRAAAQAQALSTLMSNEISKAQKRYNDAYRAAKKRSGGGGGGGGGSTIQDLLNSLGVNTTNNKKASKKFKTRDANGNIITVDADELALLKDAANSNLRVWNETRGHWDEKNLLEKMWTMDQRGYADDQIEYWNNAVNYLNNAKEL